MDKEIVVVAVLIITVLVVAIALIGSQINLIGLVVGDTSSSKNSEVNKSLKVSNEEDKTENKSTETIRLGAEKPSTSSSSSGEGGSSFGGSSSGGNTNPISNPVSEPEKPSVKIFITPFTSNYAKDNEFIIKVDISTQEKIYAAEFTLTFNPEILEILEVNEKDFLKQDGTSTSLQICEQGFRELCPIINNTDGLAGVSNTRLGITTGVTGQGSLVEIKFKAKNSGSSDLTLSNVNIVDSDDPGNVDKFRTDIVNGKTIIV